MSTTFANNMPPAEFNPAIIGDASLADLRRFSFNAMDTAVEFGSWLHRWCEHEELIRAGHKPRQADVHSVCMPPARDWSDYSIGKALEVVARLAFYAADAAVGAFVDRLVLGITGEATERLTKGRPDRA